MPVHVLHIRKTGGTALKQAFHAVHDAGVLVFHDHATRLADIPPGSPVAFVVRDPVARFVSGFNSRLRQGAPRYHFSWNEAEAAAFAYFADAAQLAEALASGDARAREAMQAIRHVNTSLSWWLGGVHQLEQRRADIVLIGRQETLDADVLRLARVVGLGQEPVLPADDVLAHRTPPGMATALTQGGEAAIRAHYAADADILRWCDAFRVDAERER